MRVSKHKVILKKYGFRRTLSSCMQNVDILSWLFCWLCDLGCAQMLKLPEEYLPTYIRLGPNIVNFLQHYKKLQ